MPFYRAASDTMISDYHGYTNLALDKMLFFNLKELIFFLFLHQTCYG